MAGIVEELAAAPAAQGHGITEVNVAMSQIDEVTQQNATAEI